MPRKREPARALGLGLSGSWVQLEPPNLANAAEFEGFDRQRELNAAVGRGGHSSSSPIAPPMLIRVQAGGEAVGVVENHPLPGNVAVFVVYLDRRLGRAGFGLEACVLYISHLFDSGARLVEAEVLEFNVDMIGILRKAHLLPQARLREHTYSAGHFWDLLVYSFDVAEWTRTLDRYRRFLPGGDRRPVAIGSVRLPG